jgi:hypothetical protein
MNRRILSNTCGTFAIATSIALAALSPDAARAQAGSGLPQPNPAEPNKRIPEKILPQEESTPAPGARGSSGTSPGESLSNQLDRDEGVIKPWPGIDPEIHAPGARPQSRHDARYSSAWEPRQSFECPTEVTDRSCRCASSAACTAIQPLAERPSSPRSRHPHCVPHAHAAALADPLPCRQRHPRSRTAMET